MVRVAAIPVDGWAAARSSSRGLRRSARLPSRARRDEAPSSRRRRREDASRGCRPQTRLRRPALSSCTSPITAAGLRAWSAAERPLAAGPAGRRAGRGRERAGAGAVGASRRPRVRCARSGEGVVGGLEAPDLVSELDVTLKGVAAAALQHREPLHGQAVARSRALRGRQRSRRRIGGAAVARLLSAPDGLGRRPRGASELSTLRSRATSQPPGQSTRPGARRGAIPCRR